MAVEPAEDQGLASARHIEAACHLDEGRGAATDLAELQRSDQEAPARREEGLHAEAK